MPLNFPHIHLHILLPEQKLKGRHSSLRTVQPTDSLTGHLLRAGESITVLSRSLLRSEVETVLRSVLATLLASI